MSWDGDKTTPIAVAGTTVLVDIDIEEGASVLWTEITNNDGANVLDAFNLLIRGPLTSTLLVVASATVDFTVGLKFPLLACSLDPVTLGATNRCLLAMEVRGLSLVRMIASADTAICSVTALWKMR